MPYEVFKSDKSGKFYFRLKARNGQVVLQSEAYEAKAGAMNGTESVKKNASSEDNFDKREAKDGSVYFVLKASNGQIIGKSEMYTSTGARDKGIASVMNNADSKVKDLT